MTALRNPAPTAIGSGASEFLASNEFSEPSTVLNFPQRLPEGLDPDGIIARHFWRGDE